MVESKPIDPDVVEKYLKGKFVDALPAARKAMTELANAFEPDELAQKGFGHYEQFRPNIPEGVKGWGANGRNLEAGSLIGGVILSWNPRCANHCHIRRSSLSWSRGCLSRRRAGFNHVSSAPRDWSSRNGE